MASEMSVACGRFFEPEHEVGSSSVYHVDEIWIEIDIVVARREVLGAQRSVGVGAVLLEGA